MDGCLAMLGYLCFILVLGPNKNNLFNPQSAKQRHSNLRFNVEGINIETC